MRAASQYLRSVKIRSFWHHLAYFQNQMPQTRPDLGLMLGLLVKNTAYLHHWALSSIALQIKNERFIYFQQNLACDHTSEQTMEFLCTFFNGRLFRWAMPLTKLGPNPIGFFTVGHLKNKIFATPPGTIEELKRCITMESIFSICYSL